MPIISTATDHGVQITIERPERRNALNLEALEELGAAVDRVLDSDARTLVLTGTDGHFCAGADLTELEDVSFTERLAEVLARLSALPIVTIAAIEGSCMGLGMQLALACDIRVVADSARFAIPVAKLGLMVDHWTIDRAIRLFGEGATRHMVLTAAVLDADDAWRLGFAQERGDLATAHALASRAAALAPLSQQGSKIGFETGREHSASLEDYREAFHRAWASEDLAEGQRAFTQRRSPNFRGR